MRNIKLTIEYDGTAYAGWQCQKPATKTIQQIIEAVLRRILREKIKLAVSGRTDSGVHAQAQVANFKTGTSLSLRKIQNGLNGLLPGDIAIIKVEEEGPGFNSRFSAKSKIYRYSILNRSYPSALLRNTVYFYPFALDLKLMQKESKVLLGRHDFSSFQASGSKVKDSIRTIKDIRVFNKGDLLHIDIEADGFLYNMVRNIVGTLIEIGRGRFPEGQPKEDITLKE